MTPCPAYFLIEGVLTLDKDFGAGYKYAAIIEDADGNPVAEATVELSGAYLIGGARTTTTGLRA